MKRKITTKEVNMKLNKSILTILKEWDSSRILDSVYAASEAVGEDPEWEEVIYSMVDTMGPSKLKKFLKDNGMTEEEFYETAYNSDPDSVISSLESYLDEKDVEEIVDRYKEIANDY